MAERPLTRRISWALTPEAFERLLAAFDPDRERAGERYERMRSMLITFFDNREEPDPEGSADETLNRVARRMEEGVTIAANELHSYVYGVARNVVREGWTTRLKSEARDDMAASDHPSFEPRSADADERERRLEFMRGCLERLDAADRDLVVRYHTGGGQERIRGRQHLADRLGIPMNALRIRVFRIRRELLTCLKKRLEGQ